MKVINVGSRYEIYDDNLKVHDLLPAKNYVVKFNNMSGFYLEEYSDITIKENKIYGVHNTKVNKVLNTFKRFDRNLGVILSGAKGIGKSLFSTLLSTEAVKIGLPLIIVDRYYTGIASYLESIQQECVVLFDEFDKTFGNIKSGENEPDAQASMLSLFDGLSQGKKLFVITCNELRSLNDYLVNRTGRFHYHFRFEYPTPQEITEYLEDKLDKRYYGEIKNVIEFSRKVDLNFDSLRAIAFEINLGETFKTVIQDLNIVNLNNEKYTICLHFENGNILKSNSFHMNLFESSVEEEWIRTSSGEYILKVNFNTSDCIYNPATGIIVIQKDCFTFEFDEDLKEEKINEIKSWGINYVTVNKCRDNKIHYLV